MRKIFAIIASLPLAFCLFAQAPAAPTPRKAGELVIHMTDGPDKLLSSYKGKMVVMAFMDTNCPHCQHMAGVLAKVQTEYAAKGVQVLGVTINPTAKHDVASFNKTFGVNFPCGYSAPEPVQHFLHVESGYYYPMLAFVDRTGMLRSQVIYMGDNAEAETFLGAPEVNIRKEIAKYNKPIAAVPHKTTKTTAP